MSMRFRRGAIRARDIDGEPAAVKLQVRIRGLSSPRLKARPTFVQLFYQQSFFSRSMNAAARENADFSPLYYQRASIRWKFHHHLQNAYPIFSTEYRFHGYFPFQFSQFISFQIIPLNLSWGSLKKRRRSDQYFPFNNEHNIYDINFYSLARKCVKRQQALFGYCYYDRAPVTGEIKIYFTSLRINSFQELIFQNLGRYEKVCSCSKRDYPSTHRIKLVITFLRVISSTKYSDPLYQMQRIDHSSKFKLLPNSKCTGSVHCVDARGQRETISSAPEIPAPSPPLWIYCWS